MRDIVLEGFNNWATNFLNTPHIKTPYACVPMMPSVILYKREFDNGLELYDFIQAEIWQEGGPAIYLALRDDREVNLKESLWSVNSPRHKLQAAPLKEKQIA